MTSEQILAALQAQLRFNQEIQTQITDLRVSVAELRASVTEQREAITELRASVAEQREAITELRASVAELRASIGELRDAQINSQIQINQLREGQAMLMAYLREQDHRRDIERQDFNRTIGEMQREVADLRRDFLNHLRTYHPPNP
ncbi:MAG: hypothetical protein Q6L58_09660 [Thermostichales cyanobacterium BF3_bins_165]